MRFEPKHGILLACALLLVALPGLGAPGWTGTDETRDGILNVFNPSTPMTEPEVLEAEPLWTTGEDEEEDIIGFVTDAQVDTDGTSYLLDSTQNEIRVHSAGGELLRTIGRRGEGPGEFNMARRMTLLPGGYLGVLQMMPGSVVTLDSAGLPGPKIEFGGSGGMRMMMRGAGCATFSVYGLTEPSFGQDEIVTTHSVKAMDASGQPLHVYREFKETSHGGEIRLGAGPENDFIRNWALGTSGRLYMAPDFGEYRIEVFDTAGQLERIIHREYKRLHRTEHDIERDREEAEEMSRQFGGDIDRDILEYERDIQDLHPRPNGHLWVETSRGMRDRPAGTVGIFDAYDEKGHFLHQVTIKADFDPRRDNFVLRGDRLFVLKEAEAQPATTSSGGGGGMQIMIRSGNAVDDDEDDDDEGMPPYVACYRI